MSDILYSKLILEVPQGLVGQNATITNSKGIVRTVKMSSPITDIIVAGMDKYRIKAGLTDKNVTFGYGQIKKVEALYAPTNLNDAPWSLIQQLIVNGIFGKRYAVGNTKTFQINNKTYTAEVVSINDGTGSAGQWYPANTVDFICKELYEIKYRCNGYGYDNYRNYGNNTFGFTGWEVRGTLNNTIYPLLPLDLKNVIIGKSHSYQSGAVIINGYSGIWSSLMVTTTNNLWLPTYYEVIGSTNSNAPGESSSNNKSYRLASKIKKVNGETSAYKWWLASPAPTSTSPFYCWCIGTDGSANSTTQSYENQGVPLCFRIG